MGGVGGVGGVGRTESHELHLTHAPRLSIEVNERTHGAPTMWPRARSGLVGGGGGGGGGRRGGRSAGSAPCFPFPHCHSQSDDSARWAHIHPARRALSLLDLHLSCVGPRAAAQLACTACPRRIKRAAGKCSKAPPYSTDSAFWMPSPGRAFALAWSSVGN